METNVLKGYKSIVGRYRHSHNLTLIATQAANSRIYEFRNGHASRHMVVTRLNIQWLQTAAHTAQILAALSVFKHSPFTVVDTTDTANNAGVTLGPADPAYPGSAETRGVTGAGVANGMTGGTMTKVGQALYVVQMVMQLAVPTAADVGRVNVEALGVSEGNPAIFGPSEGFTIENTNLLAAAAGSRVNVNLSWLEVEPWA